MKVSFYIIRFQFDQRLRSIIITKKTFLSSVIMYHNQYLKVTLVIVLMLNDVCSWNYYRSYRHVDGPKACTFIKCKDNERCVNRKFECRYPPCPNMIYCAKTPRESLRGPSSCDTVQCSKGHICLVKVRHCKWNEPCGEELARCVTEIEYHNGPASCAGYKCPAGHTCILRESFCVRPPCKLRRSCASKRDYNIWLSKCKTFGCLSSHECFLRQPGNVCTSPPCKHTPDCMAKTESQLLDIDEKCRGWICPRGQMCVAEIHEPCENFDCKIFRTCHEPLNDNYHDYDDKKKFVQNTTQLIHRRTELLQINENKNKNNVMSTKKPILNGMSPTLSSLSMWMDHLQNETGIEAVKYWIQKAEESNDYAGFHQWLMSVKKLLGVEAYAHWLDEIHDITASNFAFQQWLTPFIISKSSNSNQSNASSDNNENNDSKNNMYNTPPSSINSWDQRQNIGFSMGNMPRIIPYLFTPGNGQDSDTGKHYGYYILPPLHYSSGNNENLTQSTVQFNQQDMFRQLTDNSDNIDMKKRSEIVNLLQKIKNERLLYQEVINKTYDLVSKVKPLFPSSDIDELVKILIVNKSQTNDFDSDSFGSQRILSEEQKNISSKQDSSDVIKIMGKSDLGGGTDGRSNDYSADDDTDFILVDYNEPSALDINQTIPRILIKVENNLNPPTSLGEIGVKYDDDDDKSLTNSSNQHSRKKRDYNDDDDDEDDYIYDLELSKIPDNKTNKIAVAKFDSSKNIRKT